MIEIRLTKSLAEKAFKRSKPHLGNRHYNAPCIIGAMLKPADRKRFDNNPVIKDVDGLHTDGLLSFGDQRQIAQKLQEAFDEGSAERVEDLIAELPDE